MNATLRDALHGLPPEPPEHLGLHTTARRRAGTIRRRRAALAGTAAVTAVLAVVAGAAVLPRGDEVTPAASSPLVGTFPDWPGRGAAYLRDEQRGVADWTGWVRDRARATVVGTPRVLYAADAGGTTLAVVAGTTDPGGDRVALLATNRADPTLVEAPAPLPGVPAFGLVAFAPPDRSPLNPCAEGPVDDDRHDTTLVVVAAPEHRAARWRTVPGVACGLPALEWRDLALPDGAAHLGIPLRPYWRVELEVLTPGGWRRVPVTRETPDGAYPRVRRTSTPTALGWAVRSDGSRADALADALTLGVPGVAGGAACIREMARSLPDGTAVVLCTAPGGGPKDTRATFVADDSHGRFRAYRYPQGLIDAYVTVIEGRTGRWLVFVGPPDMAAASLVENGTARPIPLEHGTGYLRLADGEGRPGATLTTPGYPPGGGWSLTLIEGREIKR